MSRVIKKKYKLITKQNESILMDAERILVVDDEPDICALVSDILTDEGFSVTAAETAAKAREHVSQAQHDLILLDIWMPDEDGISLLKDWKENHALKCPVIVMSGHGTVDTAVEATRLGAFGFIEKPLTTAKLITSIRKALDSQSSVIEDEPASRQGLVLPVGSSSLVNELLQEVEKLAQSATNVFAIGGEGSGRSTYIYYLHTMACGKDKPFSVLSCESLNQLQEGGNHWSKQKTQIIDSIKQSSGGTLYLKNINRINNETINKKFIDLLIQLFGAKVFNRFDVQVSISVDSDVSPKLLYLLETDFDLKRLSIPRLQDHSEDIPELINYLIDQYCANEDYPYRKCSIPAQNALLHYNWPNNVAELKSLIQELLILGGEEEISLAEVKQTLSSKSTAKSHAEKGFDDLFELPLREAREAFEKQYLIKQLDKVDGSVSKLAELVGMERTNLYRKLRALGIGSK